jgi:hypothetical protein
MTQQRIIKTAFPPGFWDRWQAGPCNNPLCGHAWCPVQRAELREFGMRLFQRQTRHAQRKGMLRP